MGVPSLTQKGNKWQASTFFASVQLATAKNVNKAKNKLSSLLSQLLQQVNFELMRAKFTTIFYLLFRYVGSPLIFSSLPHFFLCGSKMNIIIETYKEF